MAYIGYKFGWYTALAETKVGLTATQFAVQTNTSARYARECLKVQAGLDCLCGSSRVYWLVADRADVLAHPDSLSYLLRLAGLQAGTAKALDQLVEAYRNDTGVSWHEFGDDCRDNMAASNRPFFLQTLPYLLESFLDRTTVTNLGHARRREITF